MLMTVQEFHFLTIFVILIPYQSKSVHYNLRDYISIPSRVFNSRQVTLSLAAKGFQKSIPLVGKHSSLQPWMINFYQDLMRESSRMPLFDLRKLNASLRVPKPIENSTKVLVIGAKDDFIVDDEGLKETGRFYDVEPVCIEGVGHDMMLDCSWEKGAEVLLNWLCGFTNH